jgi:hypothetical protein
MTVMADDSWLDGEGPAARTGLSPPVGLAADDVAALAVALARLAETIDAERAALGTAGALEWESEAAELFRRAVAERSTLLAVVAADLRDAAWQVRAHANYLYAGLDCRPG